MKINIFTGIFIFLIASLVLACTFDYGELEPAEKELPDLVMERVEYIRVRASDPIARFEAEKAERYEKQGLMKLVNFSFEQYGERGETINARGSAGNASADINTGDIFMNNGVWLEVESEDITIETFQLDWKDEPRILSSGEETEVIISQQNGTKFTGIGLIANTRGRTWEFTGDSGGSYIFEEEEEDVQESAALSIGAEE
jgi:LPS export ABC transporter protein LptC